MLSRHNAVDIERTLRKTSPPPPFPPAADRTAWSQVRAAIGRGRVDEIVAQAQADADHPVPTLPASLYLDFARTGQREGYYGPRDRRREMMRNLALAECLEGQGRFLDPLLDVAWAICEESSWVAPAHQVVLGDMARPVIDLRSAGTALQMAELDLLLGSELDPALGARIRYEIDRRILTPYLTRHDFWWLYNTRQRRVNNWTAVCNAGVVGAALYLEPDPVRLAEIIARALRSLDDYLATFAADGGSSEGMHYWTYGFGNYVLLAHLLAHRTEGQIDLLEGEFLRRVAQFPLRAYLGANRYVTFSDCNLNERLSATLLTYLARRLDLPQLETLACVQPTHFYERRFHWALRSLFWRPSTEAQASFIPNAHDWYHDMMWMVARHDPADPDALVLAAKGGHNGEMHNQNDVGNIIVQVDGEPVIVDVGRGRYLRSYFGPRRYESIVNSSLGHSLPVPNGCAQSPGVEHSAILLDHRADDALDVMVLELEGAYPAEADLVSLRRTVALHRDPPRGRVDLTDEVRFAARPGTMESVLITLGDVEIAPALVLLRGERGTLRVTFADTVIPRVELVEGVELYEGKADLRRVVLSWRQPAQEGTIHLSIEPV